MDEQTGIASELVVFLALPCFKHVSKQRIGAKTKDQYGEAISRLKKTPKKTRITMSNTVSTGQFLKKTTTLYH